MSEFFERESDEMTAPVSRISNLDLSCAFRNGIRQDFELLAKVGVSHAVLYGGALRDIDHDRTPRDYDYIGKLPFALSLERRVSKVTDKLLHRLSDKSMTVEIHEPTRSARVKFNHMGRQIDLGLISGKVPSVLQMADYGSIGLCAIASDPDGNMYASERYFIDKRDKTLTPCGGLSLAEYVSALDRIKLMQEGKYRGYTLGDASHGNSFEHVTMDLSYT